MDGIEQTYEHWLVEDRPKPSIPKATIFTIAPSTPARISDRNSYEAAVGRLRRALLGSEPEGTVSALSPVRFGTRYLAGTTVPLVGPAFGSVTSGLLVPEQMARPMQPGDMLATYVTGRELHGKSIGLREVIARLREADLLSTLQACAGLLRSFDEATLHAERDKQIAAILAAPFRGRAEEAITAGRALVVPQSVMILVKLALRYCPATPKEAENADWILIALLAIQDELGTDTAGPEVQIPGIIGDARAVAALVQTQAFSTRLDPVTLLAHAYLRWRELARRHGGVAGFTDLAEAFESATAVPLDDFVSTGLAIWVMSQGTGTTILDVHDLRLRIPRPRVKAALRLLAASPTRIRHEICEDERSLGMAWSFDAIRRFPVVRLRGQRLLVISPRLVLERVFSLVRWDLEQNFERSGRRDLAVQTLSFWQLMCEQDGLEGLATMAPPTPWGRRFYRESDLRSAFSTKRRQPKIADFAIEYPNAWIVGDVTSSTLSRDAVIGGSVDALEAGLSKVIDKARQIESTIRELERDESRLTGVASQLGRRFVPVVIMAEGFPVNAATTALIQCRLTTAGLLQEPRVGPLHILDIEELSMVEAMADEGRTLLDLLTQHEEANFKALALRDYILIEARLTPGRARRLRAPFEAAWKPIFAAIRTDSGGSDRAAAVDGAA